jgi:hypothetical protein
MEWTRAGLTAAGFAGFVTFAELPEVSVPTEAGVYAVMRPDQEPPRFLERSSGGWFKGRDPSVPLDELQQAWVPDAAVIYIGKARLSNSGWREPVRGQPIGGWFS